MEIKSESFSFFNAVESMKSSYSSSGSQSNDFDDFLTSMSNKTNDDNTYKNQNKNHKIGKKQDVKANDEGINKKDSSKIKVNKDTKSDEVRNDNEEIKNNTTDKESKVTNSKTEEKDKIEKELPKVDEELEQKLAIENLSKILGVPTEVVVKAMEELELTFADLEENKNLINLLMEVNNLTEPVELLKLDNLTEQINQVKELLKEGGKIDLSMFKEIEKEEVSLDEPVKVSHVVEEFEESGVNQLSDNNKESSDNEEQESSNEEIHKPMTSIRKTDEVKAQISINTDISDTSNNEELNIANSSVIDGIDKTSGFINQVSKEISGRNINTADVVKQLVEAMKVEVKADTTSEIKIMLRPAHLGDVTLKIATENGIVVAQFVAESEKIKAVIESNFNTLKDNLLEQGIDVGQLEVTVRDNSRDSGNETGYSNSNSGNNKVTDIMENESIEISTSNEDLNKVLGSTVGYSV